MIGRNVKTEAELATREARNMHYLAAVALPLSAGGLAMLIGSGSHNAFAWISVVSLAVAGAFAQKSALMFGRAAAAYEKADQDRGPRPTGA